MIAQRLLRRHRLISDHHTSINYYVMSKFFVYSVTFVAIIQAAEINNSGRIRLMKRSDFSNDIKRVSLADFFGSRSSNSVESKPEFISNFDVFRLMKREYAMKQFFCVIREAPCDSVGNRLKASISEALYRDYERCSSTETVNIQRIINYVKKHYPSCWERIDELYKNEENDDEVHLNVK